MLSAGSLTVVFITSFNRNFAGRNDANPDTHAFVASPEIVTAFALAGRLTFNPLTDTLVSEKGELVRLEPPTGEELPERGFTPGERGYVAPSKNGEMVQVKVEPASDRLQILTPFPPWDGKDIIVLSTSSAVRSSRNPIRVNSSRNGCIALGSYCMFFFSSLG